MVEIKVRRVAGQQVSHSRQECLVYKAQPLETQQSGCRRDPMMVDAASVYLARMRRNSEDIAGEFEVADQLKRVPEEIRSQEVHGRRVPPAGPLLRFEDCRFNAPTV